MTPRLAFVAFPLLLAAACSPSTNAPEAEARTAQLIPASALRVEVATLGATSARIDLDVPGEIKGWRDARLSAALGGYVQSVSVEAGDSVRAGQVIARVDADIHQASVDRANAQLALAKAEAARLDVMGDLATGQQRLNARTQVALAEAGLAQAEAQLRRALITAPFSGRITQVDIEAGEVANPGMPIARVVQLDPVKVTLSVPDRDVVALREGLPVRVTTNAASGVYEGTIRHLGAAANLNTRAFMVEVEVPNPEGRLLPGMIAQVAVSRELEGGHLVLPQDWIVTRLEGQGAFVERDGVAEWRPVVLGEVVRDQVLVREGVSEGDRLIVTGHRELVAGDPLVVVREGRCCTDGRVAW